MGAAEFPSLICFSPQRKQDMRGLAGSIAAARLVAFQRENLVMDILTAAASFILNCTLPCQLLPLQSNE